MARKRKLYSKADYARRIDKSAAAITKAIKDGRIIPKKHHGRQMIDAEQADQMMKADPKKIKQWEAAQAAQKHADAVKNGVKSEYSGTETYATSDNQEEEIDFSKPPDKKASRQTLERYKAYQLAQKEFIKNEQELRRLLPRDIITSANFDLWRETRDSLLNAIDKDVIKIRAAKSDHEASQIVKNSIHNSLSTVADIDDSENEVKKKVMTRLLRLSGLQDNRTKIFQ